MLHPLRVCSEGAGELAVSRSVLCVLLLLALVGCVTTGGKRVKHISEAPLDTQDFFWTGKAQDALSKDDPDGVVQAMQKAIDAARSRGDTGKEAEARLRLARILIAGGWPDRARDTLNEAVLIAETGQRDAQAAAAALVVLADLDMRQGNSASATGMLQRAVAKYDLAGNTYRSVETREKLGRVQLRADPKQARRVLEDAYARSAESKPLVRLRLQIALLLSDAHLALRDPAVAGRYLVEARQMAAANPKELGGYRVTIVMVQARAAAAKNDLDRTDDLIAEAVALVDDPRHPAFNRTRALSDLASRIWALGYVETAGRVAQRSTEIADAEAKPNQDSKKAGFGLLGGAAAAPFVQLGDMAARSGRFSEAEAAYRRALELLPETDTSSPLTSFLAGSGLDIDPPWRVRAAALVGLGRVAAATGDTAKAVEHLEAVVAVARQRGDFGLEAAGEIALAGARHDKAAARTLAARYARWAQSREATDERQQAVVLMELALVVEPDDPRVATWLASKALEANSKGGGTLSTHITGYRLIARMFAETDPDRSRAYLDRADEAQERIDRRASRVVPIEWKPLPDAKLPGGKVSGRRTRNLTSTAVLPG